MGLNWLIKLYRCQVYNSMIHNLYIVLCLHHLQSNLVSQYIWPLLPFTVLYPLPSGNDTVVCVYEFLFVCFSYVHLLFSVLYPIYEWNYVLLKFFCMNYFLLACHSKDPSKLSPNGSTFLFLWQNGVRLSITVIVIAFNKFCETF